MILDKWTLKTTEIRAWMAHNDAGAMAPVIEQTLDAGDALGDEPSQDEERDRFWEAVRAICKTLPNSPIKKGRGSTLEPAVQANVDSVKSRVHLAFAGITDAELLLEVLHPHGKTGGVYATIEDFASDMADKAVRTMKNALKTTKEQPVPSWDGLMTEDNLTGMPPPASKTSEDADEDNSEADL